MATSSSYNMRSPAVKRLLQEARELQQDHCCDYTAHPLEDNLFEWHFVIRGPDGTEFEGGRYHGRILLPSEYPFKPPNLMLMTPNGRFELNKKICLSITGYHPEYWIPAWGIRTVLLGLIGFLTTKANGAIGGIDYTEPERRRLASHSRDWKCRTCRVSNIETLPDEQDKTNQSLTSNPANVASADAPNPEESIPQFSFVYEDQQRTNGTNPKGYIAKGGDDTPTNSATASIPSLTLDSGRTNVHSVTPTQQSRRTPPPGSPPDIMAGRRQYILPAIAPPQPLRSLYMLDALIGAVLGILVFLLVKKFL